MHDFVRRSILLVSPLDRDGVAGSWRHDADAVALDLAGCVPSHLRAEARRLVRDSIEMAGRGGAEVFARIDAAVAYADLEAAAWPGLAGAILQGAETEGQIQDVAAIMTDLERRRGLPSGTLQIVLLLGTAQAVWDVGALISASPRVCSAGLDATGLCRNLGIMPREDFDPFLFASGRLVIECTAAGAQPIGISHPLSVVPRLLPAEEIERLASRGRNMGFKGAICPHPSWVAPCNRAFTPALEQIEYYREVRRVFAAGIAQGRAAVPLDGRMLDVPVDERAKQQIALWERCQKRDAEKAAALAAQTVA
jgi:citrate lyase subunit beta/citryl-CoA lyase